MYEIWTKIPSLKVDLTLSQYFPYFRRMQRIFHEIQVNFPENSGKHISLKSKPNAKGIIDEPSHMEDDEQTSKNVKKALKNDVS